MVALPPSVIEYLTGISAYTRELQCFFMAFQGCMRVREGANRDKKMAWFHAFCLSVVTGYGGGLLTPLWMGLPTPMLSNDLNVASCIISFFIVNCLPGDIGFKLGRVFPVLVLTTAWAQLFRITGLVNYVDAAFNAFKDKPSDYYPIPIIGPIAFATILGNMGPFFVNGFHGYLRDGMPYPFQNGLFCASFYHFFVNDKTGPIGVQLRNYVGLVPGIRMGIKDDRTFAFVCVSIFMHAVAMLQLPHILGPSFSPFTAILGKPLKTSQMERTVTKSSRNADKEENKKKKVS